jgi:hypothetical protein
MPYPALSGCTYLLQFFIKRSTAELTDDELRRACIWLAAQKRQEDVKP